MNRADVLTDLAGSLAERQSEFASALFDPELPVPAGLVARGGRANARRFNVYRNNVVSGLVSTLRDAYPAVRRIVGEEFFLAMARRFAIRHPPQSPMMFDYGAAFPDFILAFEPARELPYLADVARLERAWVEAYHAAEAASLEVERLALLDPETLPALRFRMHPSLRLVCSRFPVRALWEMNLDGGVPRPVDFTGAGEEVLVLRPLAEVEVRLLKPGGGAFVSALCCGRSVVEAVETAVGLEPGFDLPGTLAGLLAAGAFAGLRGDDALTSLGVVRR